MGIFDSSELFTCYTATLVFRDKIMGGTPKTPDMIEKWLRTKTGVSDEAEISTMMIRTLYEMGVNIAADASLDQIIEASKSLAGKGAVGFKRDETGLYIEDR